MQKISPIHSKAAIIFLPMLLVACASEKPVVVAPAAPILSSEKILNESQGMAHLSGRLKSGEKMIEQGNAMVRDGQQQIDEGNRMIEEGRKIKLEAEESYRNIKN